MLDEIFASVPQSMTIVLVIKILSRFSRALEPYLCLTMTIAIYANWLLGYVCNTINIISCVWGRKEGRVVLINTTIVGHIKRLEK